MKREYIKPLIAKSFNEIAYNNGIYEIYLKPLKGYKIKRYLVKGEVKRQWNRNYLILYTFNVFGDPITSCWYRDRCKIDIDLSVAGRNLNKDKISNYLGVFYTIKQEAYDSAINSLRSKKMELNKEILKLQKDLYSVVE